MDIRRLIRESLTPMASTLSKQEMLDVCVDHARKDSKRFHELDHGGAFRYFFPEQLYGAHELYFPVVMINNEIVGMAQLNKSPYRENTAWISFISMDPKYQGMGHASVLVDELFHFASQKGWDIEGSSRSEMGQQRLSHLIDRCSRKYGVKYIPSDH